MTELGFQELLEEQEGARAAANYYRDEAKVPRGVDSQKTAALCWLAAETRCTRIETAVRAEEERMRQ